jgi:hypothetical protein
MTTKIPSTITQTFHVYPDVSVTMSEPKFLENQNRKSITIVIEYPDYAENVFTGFFEVRAYDVDVDDVNEKPKVLYFDTMTAFWDDCLNAYDGPHGYIDPKEHDSNAFDEESL